MRKTLDVYEDRTKPTFRVRLRDGWTLAHGMPVEGAWMVVPTEDGGEVAVDLRRATKLHIRDRTEHDDRSYEAKQAVAESPGEPAD